jgi:hypothetical protein
MAAVNTLKKELTNVTSLQVTSLAPGTVDLILGSDFTGLVPETPHVPATPTAQASQPPASPAASPSASSSSDVAGLAQANGGITAAAACSSDGAAFAGANSP